MYIMRHAARCGSPHQVSDPANVTFVLDVKPASASSVLCPCEASYAVPPGQSFLSRMLFVGMGDAFTAAFAASLVTSTIYESEAWEDDYWGSWTSKWVQERRRYEV